MEAIGRALKELKTKKAFGGGALGEGEGERKVEVLRKKWVFSVFFFSWVWCFLVVFCCYFC